MKGIVSFPPDTTFYPMGDFVFAVSASQGVMVFDKRYVQLQVEPEVPPIPTPTPSPTPTIEYFRVAVDSLNVRVDHSLDADKFVTLKKGDPVRLIAGVMVEDRRYQWRKTESGHWVAVYDKVDKVSYLVIDTNLPGG